jgi:GDP-D-mannose dehydratase
VLELVQNLAGYSFDVRVNPAFVRANEVKLLVGNGQKLHTAVGQLPAIELKDTLRWMLEQ